MPQCAMEQAISQSRHPVHFSASTRMEVSLLRTIGEISSTGYKIAILYLEKLVKLNYEKMRNGVRLKAHGLK
jgi:hypothetical protein